MAPQTENASKYDPKYVDEVYAYIKKSKDRSKKVLKQKSQTKGYNMYESFLQVKLPTYEGLSRVIGVTIPTIHNWGKKYKPFKKALRALKAEQKDRLINNGLAGTYNSTIAKLILSSDHGMKERTDTTTKDLPLNNNNFNDEQIDRIAERVVKRRSGADGNIPSEE